MTVIAAASPDFLAGAPALRSDEGPRRRAFLGSLAGLVGLGAGVTLVGCGGGSTADDLAALRFVNGTVDYTSADFWVDDSLVYSGLANGGSATGYGSEDAGTLQVALHPVGSSTAKLSSTYSFAQSSYTSVLAYGSIANGLYFRFFSEADAAAASGSFKVRAFHAMPALGALDVYLSNTSSLSGLSPTLSISAYGVLSDFVSVTSGTYRVRITSGGDQSNVLFDYTVGVSVSSTTVLLLAIVPRSSGSLPDIAALPEQSSPVALINELA